MPSLSLLLQILVTKYFTHCSHVILTLSCLQTIISGMELKIIGAAKKRSAKWPQVNEMNPCWKHLLAWFALVKWMWSFSHHTVMVFLFTIYLAFNTQQNSYSVSHLLGTVTTQWLPLWRCSHCSLVLDTVTT